MKTKFLAAVSLLPLMVPATVHAQSDADDGETEREVITVTALKREQSLLEVPAAVTVFDGEELDRRAIQSIQDLSFAVPGLALREDGPGSYQIFLRGLSNQYGNGALVGVYLDESPVSLTGFDQLSQPNLDLARIEVLKGPQGTLYGQGSVSGVIRYITNSPDLSGFSAYLEGQLTTVNDGDIGKKAEAVLNLPVVKDVFGLRVAATLERDGGWQDQPEAGIEDGNGQDLEHIRIKALWNITDNFSAEAKVAIHNAEHRLGQGYEQPDRTVNVAIDPAKELIPKDFEYQIYALDLIYDFGGVELLSATTRINHDHNYPFSYVGGPETIWEGGLEGNDARFLELDQFTQEVRLTSTGDGRFNWTLGGFYKDVDRELFVNDIDTLFFGTLFPDAIFESDLESQSYAVFADASFAVTDRITVGVGGRYFSDDQISESDGGDDTFDKFDPRAFVSFAVSEAVNVYASYGQGFRSGGFNSRGLPPYGPETLKSYEIGVKGSAFDGVLDFEIAAYYSDYDDMLRRGLVFVEESGEFLSLTSNVGKAEILGIEFGFNLYPTEGLSLYATGSVIDTEIKEVNAEDATNIAGDIIDYVPEFAFTLGGQYSFEISNSADGFVRIDFSHRDRVPYTDRTSFPGQFVPQFSDELNLLNARMGATFGNKWVELFVTNLTNENKYIDPYHQWTNANRTRPRTFGIRFGIDIT
ncbi:MAG: TonB-dependent receptor [Sphingomonadales bacterium]|nr:TonB-dependent receptor [Sphingomonadales bacterium]